LLALLIGGLQISIVAAKPAPPTCKVARYEVRTLPLVPVSVNEAGEVAGTTSDHRAAIWDRKKGLRVLALPPGFTASEAVAINDSGRVVGVVSDLASNRRQGFVYKNNTVTLLDGEQASAYGMGDPDAVVGESLIGDQKRTQPVVWSDQGLSALPNCCGGVAKSINNRGQVVGDAYDAQDRYHAFLWTPAEGMRDIGPPGSYSSAIAINARGHVLINEFTHTLLYADGRLEPLQLSSTSAAHPRSLNACDVVVGSFGPYSDASKAFIWERTYGFRDLNTRIKPGSQWTLEQALHINDRGEIVGLGDLGELENQGFLLVPEQ
jgi:probable HAF family extracellular repeat protein